MANINFYTRTKEVGGVKYTAQFSGLSTALQVIDSSYIDSTSNISMEKLSKQLFEKVIVEPKGLTADDFETFEDFNEVTTWARDVMQGYFRHTADENAAPAKGRK